MRSTPTSQRARTSPTSQHAPPTAGNGTCQHAGKEPDPDSGTHTGLNCDQPPLARRSRTRNAYTWPDLRSFTVQRKAERELRTHGRRGGEGTSGGGAAMSKRLRGRAGNSKRVVVVVVVVYYFLHLTWKPCAIPRCPPRCDLLTLSETAVQTAARACIAKAGIGAVGAEGGVTGQPRKVRSGHGRPWPRHKHTPVHARPRQADGSWGRGHQLRCAGGAGDSRASRDRIVFPAVVHGPAHQTRSTGRRMHATQHPVPNAPLPTEQRKAYETDGRLEAGSCVHTEGERASGL